MTARTAATNWRSDDNEGRWTVRADPTGTGWLAIGPGPETEPIRFRGHAAAIRYATASARLDHITNRLLKSDWPPHADPTHRWSQR